MKEALEIFKQICMIPHGSGNLDQLQSWIVDHASKLGCHVQTDAAKNIYISKGEPKLCFQGHYDMVAVGVAGEKKPIETYEKDGILRAKNSSLGADNGIAVAAMLALFKTHTNFEALITADEEVGMCGAKALDIAIKSKTMINLDSEEFGEIVISCAGGFDANIKLELYSKDLEDGDFYCVQTQGFKGGHSGSQIGQNIANAITELARFCQKHECEVASFKGGEKRNSIPVNAKAIVCSKKDLSSLNEPGFKIEKASKQEKVYKNLAKILLGFHQGVLAIDPKSKDVLNSRNLAIVELKDDLLCIQIMGRANKMSMMEQNIDNIKAYFNALAVKNAKVDISGKYAPWENDALTIENSELLSLLKSCFKDPKIVNIHAGLECGILQKRLEDIGVHDIEIFSIGPNISHPHSVDELLELDSFEKIYKNLEDLLDGLNKG